MNILMLGRWVPPPRQAVRATREYQFAGALARRHRLTLAFITDNPEASGPISTLRAEFGDLEFAAVPRAWRSLVSAVRVATGESCTLSYVRSEALQTRLAARLKSTPYGLVFVTSSSMIQYALEIDPGIPLVVDFGEMESEWWFRQAAQRGFPGTSFLRTEGTRLRTAEAVAAQRAAACFAATAKAAATVQTLVRHAPVTVVPSGVDAVFLSAPVRPGTFPTAIVHASSGDRAQMQGIAEFCKVFLPAIRARVPALRLVVVSRDPIASSWANELHGAEIAAPVNDLRRVLHSQAVVIAPLRSEVDVRAAIVEPMAAGVPVVSTSPLCEQLGACAGRDLLVADQPLEFVGEVARLMESVSLRQEIAHQGRRFVEASCSWSVYSERVNEVLDHVLKLPRASVTSALSPGGIAAIAKQ
jgi:hypothetical protein